MLLDVVGHVGKKALCLYSAREVQCRPCKCRFDLLIARLHVHGKERGVEMQENSVELSLKYEAKPRHNVIMACIQPR